MSPMLKVYLLYLGGSFLYQFAASFPVATDLDEVYSMKKMEWRIPETFCAKQSRINIQSNRFESFDSKYYLTFSSDDKKRLFIDVIRYKNESDDIHVSLSLKRADGTKVALTRASTSLYPEREKIGYMIDPSKYCLEIGSKGSKNVSAPSKMMIVTLYTWKGELGKDANVVNSQPKTPDDGSKPCLLGNTLDLSTSTLQDLDDLFVTGKYHDITFNVEGREFKAHLEILEILSPAFADRFQHRERENPTDSIVLRDFFSKETFEDFLRYIYTFKVCDLTPMRAIYLYKAANKYELTNLKGMCVEYLKGSLSTADVCSVISMAAEHYELDLLQKAEAFFMKHTEEILDTPNWISFLALNPIQATKLWLKTMKENPSDVKQEEVDLVLK